MIRFPCLTAFMAAACLILSPLSAYAEQIAASAVKDGVPRHVATKLIPEFDSVIAGQPLTIAIDQTMESGWHTYWKNPGDSGEATSITWSLPKGWKNSELIFPTPHRMPTGPLMNYGYSDRVVLLTTLTPPDNIDADQITLTAEISWLVCADICVPEQTTATITLSVNKNSSALNPTDPALFESARKAIPQLAAWQGGIEEKSQSLTLSFMTDDETVAALTNAHDMYFYPEDWGLIQYAAPQNIVLQDGKLNITLQRDTRPLNEFTSIKGVFTYTPNNTAEAEQPRAVYIDVPLMEITSSTSPSVKNTIAAVNADDVSFIQAIFLAFLGGMILNLMPCVFPVLSMKALSLVKMSEREQRHAATHGLLYTAGILVCFLGIAGLMIALQVAGNEIGWGFQLQNPVVVLLLAYLLFIMGMNLSGFFEFHGSFLANIGHKLASHHGYTGTFFTGVLATLVATPCTAPFMATAMGYALTQPAPVALSVFAALGLGLAAPYLALCFIPSLRKSLPRPGAWMETFRQFMAFPLYASVAWLVWVYAQQASGSYGVLLALIGIICLALAVWIGRHTPTRQPMKLVLRGFAIFVTFVALLIAAGSGIMTAQQGTQGNTISMDYTPFSKESFAKAMDENDPLFIDMTAAWCITCKINEKLALDTLETRTLFEQKKVKVFVGDWTNQNPEITEFLQSYGRSGVPLYVYIGPRDMVTGKRPDSVVLPQLLTNGVIAETILGKNDI